MEVRYQLRHSPFALVRATRELYPTGRADAKSGPGSSRATRSGGAAVVRRQAQPLPRGELPDLDPVAVVHALEAGRELLGPADQPEQGHLQGGSVRDHDA